MKSSTIVSCLLAILCVCNIARSLEPDDPALIGLWLCDEGNGNKILDSSGNENHATGTFEWGEGKFGDGIELSQGSVDVQTSDSVNSIVDQITIAGWFRIEADSDTGVRRQNAYLLEDQSATETIPDSWAFGVWTPGVIVLWGKTEVEQEEWTHIAGTYDGKSMKLYLNGQLDSEMANTGSIQVPADLLQLKYGPETYIGGMDEIVLFNRALDQNEVAALAKGWEAAMPVESVGQLSATWGRMKSLN